MIAALVTTYLVRVRTTAIHNDERMRLAPVALEEVSKLNSIAGWHVSAHSFRGRGGRASLLDYLTELAKT